MTINEVIKKIEDTSEDLEPIVDEWLEGYNTPDEIVGRTNEIFQLRLKFPGYNWIEHKNKRIFFCDVRNEMTGRFVSFSNFTLANFCKSLPADVPFLALYNLEKMVFTMDSNRAMKKVAENASHITVSKAAFYKLNIFKRLIVKAGKSENTVQFFGKKREEALDWLASQ